MDLIAGLRAFAFRRPHVLPLVGAGATRQRLAAERWLRTRGWPIAATPADADILLICGAEAKIADAVYAGMPLPKSRTEVLHGDAIVAQALEAARARLFEGEHPVEAPAHNLHSDHGDMHVAEYAEHDHPKEAPGGHGEYAGTASTVDTASTTTLGSSMGSTNITNTTTRRVANAANMISTPSTGDTVATTMLVITCIRGWSTVCRWLNVRRTGTV
jgi:hypothetical protein